MKSIKFYAITILLGMALTFLVMNIISVPTLASFASCGDGACICECSNNTSSGCICRSGKGSCACICSGGTASSCEPLQ